MHPLNQKIMIIPPNFLVKTIPLYSEGDVSTPHVVINYLTRSLFFILLKFPPNWKLIKVKEIKDRIFIKNLDHKMTMGLMEAKRIVDELTIEYDMNNIYRIRLVEQPEPDLHARGRVRIPLHPLDRRFESCFYL